MSHPTDRARARRPLLKVAGSILFALAPLAIALVAAGCPGSLSFQYVPPDGNGGMGGDVAGGTGGDVTGGSGGAPGGMNGGGTGGDGSVVTSCDGAMNLLRGSCGACHASPPLGAVYTSLDLLGAGAAARLVGHAADSANQSADECSGKGNILDRGTLPATGILIDKINGVQTCGTSMPFGLPLLGASDIACIQAWANGLVQSVGN